MNKDKLALHPTESNVPKRDSSSTLAPLNDVTTEQFKAIESVSQELLALKCGPALKPILKDLSRIVDSAHRTKLVDVGALNDVLSLMRIEGAR